MKTKDLRLKTETEFKNLEMELREKLRDLRFNLAQGKLKNIKSIRELKRDMARIITIFKEKKLKINQ